jgi:hypothetical protein
VYVHGNYNPILKNLLPVTVANSLPPLLRKKLNTLLCSMGTCPTHCSLFPSFRTSLIYKFHLETCMEQQMEFNFESSIRGYHVYRSIWTYEIGEKLRCDCVRWARVLHIVLYFHHFERVSQQICHLDYFLLCHNEVSRRFRMSG